MKHFILTLSAIFLFGFAMGQNAIEKNFTQYKAQENFSKVSVKGKMFQLTSHIEVEAGDKDLKEAKDFLASITAFNALFGQEMDNAQSEYTAALAKVSGQYEELMSVEDKDGSFTLFINESNGIVKELVLIGTQENNLLIFSLEGNMELKKLSQLAQITRTDEFKEMGKMFTHNVEGVKVYPNPVAANKAVTLELPTELEGAEISILDVNGAMVKTISSSGNKQDIETSGLAPGVYIMKIQKDKVSVTKKVVVQ